MKKTLGKKSNVQDGTLVAFSSCSCTSSCQSVSCTGTNLSVQNTSQMLAILISGQWGW